MRRRLVPPVYRWLQGLAEARRVLRGLSQRKSRVARQLNHRGPEKKKWPVKDWPRKCRILEPGTGRGRGTLSLEFVHGHYCSRRWKPFRPAFGSAAGGLRGNRSTRRRLGRVFAMPAGG